MRFKRFVNIHTILLLIVVLTILGLVYRFLNWGQKIDLGAIDFDNQEDKPDTLDIILPALDAEHNIITDKDDTTTIVFFGNAPFADDRDSKDNLVNLISDKTGATVYNCSISGSYLAAGNPTIDPDSYPLDSYNFYWLTHVAVKNSVYTRCGDAAEVLGDQAPPEAPEVYDTLWNLNFEDVDVIAIMYDASDYLDGHEIYNIANETDIQQFTGNLEAGIDLLQSTYPWLRIIVMSPTYAYALDENGNYVSSDLYTYGEDVLATYVIREQTSCFNRSVSFVDNLYGTITEDNAKDYLTDHLHLNQAGRELVAERFVYALHYYDE